MIDIHHCPECDEYTMDSTMVCLSCGFPYVDKFEVTKQVIAEYIVQRWCPMPTSAEVELSLLVDWLEQQED